MKNIEKNEKILESYIKSTLISFFEGKEYVFNLTKEINQELRSIEEIPTYEMIFLFISLLKGFAINFTELNQKIENINEFVEKIEKIYEEFLQKETKCNESKYSEYIPQLKRILTIFKTNQNSRDDKLFINTIIKDFSTDFINWDDREFYLKAINYSLAKILIFKRHAELEQNIRKYDKVKDIDLKPKIIQLNPCGHHRSIVLPEIKDKSSQENRKELFTRRIKPKMSLDEFAELILEDMRKRELDKFQSGNINENEEKSFEDLKDRKTEILKDIENEKEIGFRGRNRNQG